jgi:hypothetical protein
MNPLTSLADTPFLMRCVINASRFPFSSLLNDVANHFYDFPPEDNPFPRFYYAVVWLDNTAWLDVNRDNSYFHCSSLGKMFLYEFQTLPMSVWFHPRVGRPVFLRNTLIFYW